MEKKYSSDKDPNKGHGKAHGISLKKQFGQHFLRDQSVVDHMLDQVDLRDQAVFEIGCGDGFLTKSILQTPMKKFWVFEIDRSWANYVRANYPDKRMKIFEENILDVDFAKFKEDQPWVLLANLPYQITFPILYRLTDYRYLFKEGVIMIQEEVAQKIVKTSGKKYGFHSLYLQHLFTWKLLQLVPPGAFYPPPKVNSRLLYFKPIENPEVIEEEENFWIFVKRIFLSPRRNLKNNLKTFHYNLNNISEETLNLRAQQMSMADILNLWRTILSNSK